MNLPIVQVRKLRLDLEVTQEQGPEEVYEPRAIACFPSLPHHSPALFILPPTHLDLGQFLGVPAWLQFCPEPGDQRPQLSKRGPAGH